MKLIITRHGETEENKQGIIQGHLQGTLSELGKEQARKLAERLKNEKIDLILSSDLARAKDTSTEIAKFHPKIPLELKEELRERFLGNFQGGEHTDYWHKAKFDDELCKKENVELLEELQRRAGNFIEEIKKNNNGKNILLVSHVGIGLSLINHILGKSSKDRKELERLGNTSLTIFEFDEEGKPKLKLFNCIKHLE